MLTCLELFSGAGGLALGLEQAGFHHIALVERNQIACRTLKSNHAKNIGIPATCHIVSDDVRNVNFRDLVNNVSLVAGGPPCQPFSMGGKAHGFDDSRDMFPEAIRAVHELLPPAFLFENVRGLLRPAFSNYVEFIRLRLTFPEFPISSNVSWESNLGRLQRHATSGSTNSGVRYNVFVHIANAADYGIPQKRHRVFFVGFRSDLQAGWSFPKKTHSEEALLWDKYVTGHYWDRFGIARKSRLQPPKRIESRIQRLRENLFVGTGAWRTARQAFLGLPVPRESIETMANHTLQLGARAYPGHTGSPYDEPAKALKAGDHGVPGGENMLAFPDGSVRYFTVRESARLQTFPDEWFFHGSWTESMRQLGNAVPVQLARIVGQSIRKVLETTAGLPLHSR